MLLDWGPVPGSYGWVFPKGDMLTVGVIGARTEAVSLRAYYAALVNRLGLAGVAPAIETGHLTRVRTPDSPLGRGSVLVAGDAAGLLEPWTREGISFALRSGRLAGEIAASGRLADYPQQIARILEPEMAAGRVLLTGFHGVTSALSRPARRPWLRALFAGWSTGAAPTPASCAAPVPPRSSACWPTAQDQRFNDLGLGRMIMLIPRSLQRLGGVTRDRAAHAARPATA